MNSSATASTTDALRQHYLFGNLTESELREVADHARRVSLVPSEVLFRQGDPADRFFLVTSGRIKLFRLSAEGQEKIVEVMGPGKTFAEAAMFMEHHQFPVNATALTRGSVYGIPNQAYIRVLRNNPDSCLRLLADLSARLHHRLNETEHLSLGSATGRVVHYLVSHLPEKAEDGCEIRLDLPKQVIAARLAVKPETLSRILHHLSTDGIVAVQGPRVRVLSVSGLMGYA